MWRLQSSEIWQRLDWYSVSGGLEDLAAYFAISSVHLPLSPLLSNLCSWSSTVEWPTITPWPYIFVGNRRRKGTLILNNVQQHDLSAINKIYFSITADYKTLKSFSFNWNGASIRWSHHRACRGCSQVQPAFLFCVHPASAALVVDQPSQGAFRKCWLIQKQLYLMLIK